MASGARSGNRGSNPARTPAGSARTARHRPRRTRWMAADGREPGMLEDRKAMSFDFDIDGNPALQP